MSQVFFTESGSFWPTLGEELTHYRRARKVLKLPPTAHSGTFYVLARPHSLMSPPLQVSVNGSDPLRCPPTSPRWEWLRLEVPPARLRRGRNTFDLWCDTAAMDGWSLALEIGHRDPQSFLSRDAGATWQSDGMGFANLARGEYGVRLRLREGADPAPATMAWEHDSESLRRLLRLVPPGIVAPGPTLDVVRRLSSWVSQAWNYYNESPLPAPLDPPTIIAWGRSREGYGGYRPTVHCVHYAVTFGLLCHAVGIPARCSALIGSMTPADETESGHFLAEVWVEECQKWAMVDPTLDGMAFHGDTPLSVAEVQKEAGDLGDLIRWGPGHARQIRDPALRRWVPAVFLRGRWMKFRALWPRMDFLTRPELLAASHGLTAYSETGLVWGEHTLDSGFGMFPLFGSPDYFDARPESFPR